MKKIKILNKDSFIHIDKMIEENQKVNHIITDPPYNISKKNNFKTLKNRSGIDFGEWDKNFKLFEWIPKSLKLLEKDGSIIIFCSYLSVSYIANILEKNDVNVKDILVWKKSNPMPRNVNRRYAQDMEFAIWGTKKGAKWVFNKNSNLPYQRSLFEYPICAGKERTPHPTQKNLKLMMEIIKIHTNKNHLVFDPFMGSGTTGEACAILERNFIGIEKNKHFFEIAKKRLKL